MLICNRCNTSIQDGARFCGACGDPVTAGDLVRNRLAPGTHESVHLVCPQCEQQALQTVPSHGVGQITCPACATVFDTAVVRVRSKRSTGQKKLNTRSFSVRTESLDGHERLIEFVRPSSRDFELRSKDLAAFTSVNGRLTVVQNLSVGEYMTLKVVNAGCVGALLLWIGAAGAAGAIMF
jgi:hypothetical protein